MKKVILFASFVTLVLMSFTTKPKPATYKLDATKSTFKWTGKKVTGSHWGYIKFTDGQLTTDGNNIVGGAFTVDMNSMDCQDTKGEYGTKLLGHLKSDDFFGAEKFPTSTLTIKKVTLKTGNNYDVVADLTIKGTTGEVIFPAVITKDATTLTAQAAFKINRTKYGIKYGSGSFFDNLGDKAISDDFEVDVNIAAVNAVPAATVAPAAPAAKITKKPTVKKKAATSSK
jgi:polyisoprenoid-binding protein YceI